MPYVNLKQKTELFLVACGCTQDQVKYQRKTRLEYHKRWNSGLYEKFTWLHRNENAKLSEIWEEYLELLNKRRSIRLMEIEIKEQLREQAVAKQGKLPDRKTLSLEDASMLSPFYAAREGLEMPETWRQLRERGLSVVEKESLSLEKIKEDVYEVDGSETDPQEFTPLKEETKISSVNKGIKVTRTQIQKQIDELKPILQSHKDQYAHCLARGEMEEAMKAKKESTKVFNKIGGLVRKKLSV